MSKNVLSQILLWNAGNGSFYYPLFELLRNDCTLSIDIVTNTCVDASPSDDTEKHGYDSWSTTKEAAKISVIIRGANDYQTNGVDKVYYSKDNKLSLNDFTVLTDAIDSHLFGLKEYDGHIYFCSNLTDRKANYSIEVLSYDIPPYAEEGLTCNAYRPCNWTDDYNIYSQYWYSVDKNAVYTQFDRGCEHKILLPSDSVLKVKLRGEWNRFSITAEGTGISTTINDFISVYQQPAGILNFRRKRTSYVGNIYTESTDVEGYDPTVFYIDYNAGSYDGTLIKIIAKNIMNIRTEIIPRSEFSTEGKTLVTDNFYYGPSPSSFNRAIGAQFFTTWDGAIPNTPLWWTGSDWVMANGFSATPTKGGTGARPVGKHTEGSTTVGVLNPNFDIGFEYFDLSLNKVIRAKAINASNGVVTWVEEDGAIAGVKRSGTKAQRPSGGDIYVGFQYMQVDTTNGTFPIWASAISGSTVTWVKADGSDPDA